MADIEQYVWACRSLGYQHPDLTAHPGQVRERYLSEDGMDLLALDADCAALQAVTTVAEEALVRQRDQLAALESAWRGAGADASRRFLARHSESSQRAADGIRTAAAALADLRDRLWRAVDGKAAAVLAIGDGTQPRRAEWLAAAHTVTTGSGDRAAASELVDHELKPFVDSVIGGEFMTAMRAATDEVEAAYREAVAALAAASEAAFGVPGELGPVYVPAEAAVPAAVPPAVAPVAAPTPVLPAGFAPAAAPGSWSPAAAPPPSPPPAAVEPGPVTPAAAAEPPAAAPMSAPSMPSMPSLGGGMPEIGSGLSSFGQQLGEMLGGLLGDGALGSDGSDFEADDLGGDGFDEDVVDDEEVDDVADEETAEDETAAPVDPAAEGDSSTAPVCPPPEDAPVEGAAEPPAVTPPDPPTVPPPDPPTEPPAELAAGTPCEIAADELPQVGE